MSFSNRKILVGSLMLLILLATGPSNNRNVYAQERRLRSDNGAADTTTRTTNKKQEDSHRDKSAGTTRSVEMLERMKQELKDHESGANPMDPSKYQSLMKRTDMLERLQNETPEEREKRMEEARARRSQHDSRRAGSDDFSRRSEEKEITREDIIRQRESQTLKHKADLEELREQVRKHESGEEVMKQGEYDSILKKVGLFQRKLESLQRPLDESHIQNVIERNQGRGPRSRRSRSRREASISTDDEATRAELIERHEKAIEVTKNRIEELRRRLAKHDSGEQKLKKNELDRISIDIKQGELKLESLSKPLTEEWLQERVRMMNRRRQRRSEL